MNFRHGLVCAAITFWALACGFAAGAQGVPVVSEPVISAELQSELRSSNPGEFIPVIIAFDRKAQPENFRQADRRQQRANMIDAMRSEAARTDLRWRGELQANGGRSLKRLWIRNAIAAELPAQAVQRLATRPGIRRIDLDATVFAVDTTYASNAPTEWNLDVIGASALWAYGVTGAGATVASLDTGADALHLDLAASWRGGPGGWYDPHGVHPTPYDKTGHGTQTIGLMVGRDATGSSIGVAPDAKWIAAKIFDDQGQALVSDITLAFQWALDPDGDPSTDDAPDVVSNSWGYSTLIDQCNPVFEENIAALRAAGIAVVFAAGNTGSNAATSTPPANSPGVLSVGSVDGNSSLSVSSFSARGPGACAASGPFPTLVAPGRNIKTADLTFGFNTTAAAVVDGTSFAAPQVAGAIALLSGAMPEKSLDEIEAALWDTAGDLGPVGSDNDYGYGILNVEAAYRALGGAIVVDQDGDGYDASEDCNDNDASIHPGATEDVRDGIDQDCNGYDLTIIVELARYQYDKDKIVVWAQSQIADPGVTTDLMVRVNFTDGSTTAEWPIRYNETRGRWLRGIYSVSSLGADPVSITITGAEGSVTERLQITGLGAVDFDEDGYAADVDCNDGNPAIHPDADEIVGDGIDQDCNGSDLTIRITRAWDVSSRDALNVIATSDLADTTDPQAMTMRVEFADGTALDNLIMVYNSTFNRWQRALGALSSRSVSRPVRVIVSGAEGSVAAAVETKT